MNKIARTYLLIFWIFLIACEEDEYSRREYPRLKSLPVTDITKGGALFHAEFLNRGNSEIISYGFVWSSLKNPTIESSDKVIFYENIQSPNFSIEIESALTSNLTYFVRPFVTTSEFTVYGTNISFLSLGSKAPKIELITPLEIFYNDTVLIYGKHFSFDNSNNIVKFGEIRRAVIEASDSLLTVLVPESISLVSAPITVSVSGNVSNESEKYSFIAPEITSISHNGVVYGDTVTIVGHHFAPKENLNTVKIGDEVMEIVAVDENEIQFVFTAFDDDSDQLSITNSLSQSSTFDAPSVLQPEIVSITPDEAFWGDEVEIIGKNFSHIDTLVSVLFNGVEAEILTFSNSKIVTNLPPDLNNPIELKIEVNGETSNESSIYYLGPEIISVYPQEATWGDHLTIVGNNFSENKEEILLYINGEQVDLLSSTDEELQFVIPNDILEKRLDLEVSINNSKAQSEYNMGRLEVISVSPSEVSNLEEIITIVGNNFHPDQNINSILLNGKNLTIVSSTQNEIFCKMGSSFLENPLLTTYVGNRLNISNGAESASSNHFIFNYTTEWLKVDTDYNFSYFGNIDAYFTIGDKGYFVFRDRRLYEFNFQNNSFTRKSSFPGDGGTNRRRFYGTAFTLGGEGYYGLGVVECINQSNPNIVCGKAKNDLWKYNAESDTWSRLNDVPISGGFVIELDRNLTVNAATVTDESVYLTSLMGTGGNFLYDSSTDSWVQKEPINNETSVISQSLRTFAIGDKMYAVYKNYEGTYHVAEYLDYSDTWSIIRSEVGFNFILDIRVLGDRVIMLDVNYEDNVTFSSKLKSAAIVDLEFNEIESPSDQMVAIPFIRDDEAFVWGSKFDDLILKYTLR